MSFLVLGATPIGKKVHELADLFGLLHYSRGARGQRILTVEKPGFNKPIDEWQDFGYIALFGPQCDSAALKNIETVPQVYIERRIHLDGPLAHIDLMTKEEKLTLLERSSVINNIINSFKHLGEAKLTGEKNDVLMNIIAEEIVDDWRDLGLGKVEDKYNVVWFKVIEWASAAKLRGKLGLAPKDFHINVALQGSDTQAVKKDRNTLVTPTTPE